MPNNVIFKVGTKALYDALEQKDSNTLYWLTDKKEIRKGEELYAVGREATTEEAALLSAADKAKLDSITGGSGTPVTGLTPVDATIILGDGEDGGKTIKVGVSADEGNLIEVRDDGIFVAVDQESVEQAAAQAASEAAASAVNEFANKVSDDGTVNTFKELVDYVAEHAPEAADMASDIADLQGVIDSLPDEFMSEITSVSRTETTNVAQIRLSVKQPDGTYSTAQEHGVLTLIGAGQGPDGVNGAGLMTYADKVKLDAIDLDVISSISDSLVWGTL